MCARNMPDLNVQRLELGGLRLVYPLVRSATGVPLAQWEAFGHELVTAGGGVITVVSPDGCIHGVAGFRPRPSLRHRKILDVEVFAAFELHGNDRVRQLLCAELARQAAASDCSSVKITVSHRNADLGSRGRRGMERLGLKLDTAAFVADLESATAAKSGNRLRERHREL